MVVLTEIIIIEVFKMPMKENQLSASKVIKCGSF